MCDPLLSNSIVPDDGQSKDLDEYLSIVTAARGDTQNDQSDTTRIPRLEEADLREIPLAIA